MLHQLEQAAAAAAPELPDPAHTGIVVELFERVISHLSSMVQHHRAGELEQRFMHFKSALAILEDLYSPLEQNSGDEWSEQTGSLYMFVIRDVTGGIIRNDIEPTERAILLLNPLRFAWQTLDAQARLRSVGNSVSDAAVTQARA